MSTTTNTTKSKEKPVIPAQAGIQFLTPQPERLPIKFKANQIQRMRRFAPEYYPLDSRFRGNDESLWPVDSKTRTKREIRRGAGYFSEEGQSPATKRRSP
jgi:hypothetical protein